MPWNPIQYAAFGLGAYLLFLLGREPATPGRRRRRILVRKYLTQRRQQGAFLNLVPTLREHDKDVFLNFLRMPEHLFLRLLQLVSLRIIRKKTNWRAPLSLAERLTITLRFLAAGDSYKSLQFLFRVSSSTISLLIPETCNVLYAVLAPIYMKYPDCRKDWEEVADRFETKWQLPMCLGALDGKHINIRCPPRSGSAYYNYKGNFSIVLMAIADADYKFKYVDVGCQGRISDGGVFAGTNMDKAIRRGSSRFPLSQPLPGDDRPVSYYFVADDAFAMNEKLMKPYSHKNLTHKQAIFNYRLSRGRRVVENSFGIMTARFRVLLSIMLLHPKNATLVTLACCVLHNLLRDKIGYSACDFDRENAHTGAIADGAWRRFKELPAAFPPKSANATNRAKEQRNFLCEYFNSELGSIPSQNHVV